MRKLIPLGVLLAVVCFGCKKKNASGASLDGKTYQVKVIGEPADTLIFSKGKFESTGCRKYGFTTAAYQTTRSGPGWKFTATTQSPKEGQIFWSGTAAGDNITGTYKWAKKNQKPITKAFTGSLKK